MIKEILQNRVFAHAHDIVFVAAQIPLSGSGAGFLPNTQVLNTQAAYSAGSTTPGALNVTGSATSGMKGGYTVTTGSAGNGSYVVTLSDFYPRVLYWDVRYQTPSIDGLAFVQTQSDANKGKSTTFNFELHSGSNGAVKAPSSGSFANFIAVLQNR